MFLAMCADAGMLIGALFMLMALGVICCVPFILAFVALGKWADARQKRMAAESPILR